MKINFSDFDFLEIGYRRAIGYSWTRIARTYGVTGKTIKKYFDEWDGIRVPEGNPTFYQLSEFAARHKGVSRSPRAASSDFLINNKRK